MPPRSPLCVLFGCVPLPVVMACNGGPPAADGASMGPLGSQSSSAPWRSLRLPVAVASGAVRAPPAPALGAIGGGVAPAMGAIAKTTAAAVGQLRRKHHQRWVRPLSIKGAVSSSQYANFWSQRPPMFASGIPGAAPTFPPEPPSVQTPSRMLGPKRPREDTAGASSTSGAVGVAQGGAISFDDCGNWEVGEARTEGVDPGFIAWEWECEPARRSGTGRKAYRVGSSSRVQVSKI